MKNSFNPFSANFNESPYPFYDELRTNAPIVFRKISPHHSFWFVSKHDHIAMILDDPRFVREHKTVFPEAADWTPPKDQKELYASLGNWVLFKDPPRHTFLRKHISQAFQKAIDYKKLVGVTQKLTDELLKTDHEYIDILHEFAVPLPVQLFASILGLPPEDGKQLKEWSDFVVSSFDISNQPESAKRVGNTVILEMESYFNRQVEEKRKFPKDDLISKLLEEDSQGNTMTDAELVSNIIFLLGAGHETTTSLISNGLYTLLHHSDQLQNIRSNPTLISNAVEEILRYESPIQMTFRIAAEDVEIKGNTIKKGDQVCLLLGSGNRDEDIFENGNTFDIQRANANRHLSFAAGPHFCIGSHLAKLEANIAITAFLTAYPHASLRTGDVEWKKNPSFRVMDSCKVQLNKLASQHDKS